MRSSFSTVMVSPLMTATGRLESSATAAAVDCGAAAVFAGAGCCAKAAEASSSSGMSVRLIKSNPPDGVSDDALTNRVTGGEHSDHAVYDCGTTGGVSHNATAERKSANVSAEISSWKRSQIAGSAL